MNRTSPVSLTASIALGIVVLWVAGAANPIAAGSGQCVAARTTADVILPDGSSHPAGKIQICLTQAYSPVAGLHKAELGDGFQGMLMSRRRLSEGAVEGGEPYIQFVRAVSGEWILDAYAVPHGERMWLYEIQPFGKSKKVSGKSAPKTLLALNDDGRPQIVLLASAAY